MALSERLNVLYGEVDNKLAPSSPPSIALDATDKLFTIMLNLNHGLVAAVAVHGYASHKVPS
jgi:hypothetical protein